MHNHGHCLHHLILHLLHLYHLRHHLPNQVVTLRTILRLFYAKGCLRLETSRSLAEVLPLSILVELLAVNRVAVTLLHRSIIQSVFGDKVTRTFH